MFDMIRVIDTYNLVPGLFQLPGFQKAEHADCEVLPTSSPESFQHSNKLTVFVDSEPDINHAHLHFVQQCQCRPNAVWAVSCSSPSLSYKFDTVVEYWSNLVFTTVNNAQCRPVDIDFKPWLANVLLGGYMPNRTKVFNLLIEHGIEQQCLINYQPRQGQQQFVGYRTSELDILDTNEWTSIARDPTGFFTMRPLGSPNEPGWQSQKISRSVYNSSWISVVAETENLAWPDSFLPSEKIAKPLLLGQPFLVQACSGFLKQLKNIGFKTFSTWINEDYDLIEHSDTRIAAMVASLYQFSCYSDQTKLEMLTDMKSVCDHNRNVMLNLAEFSRPLAAAIRQKLGLAQ